MGCLPLLNLSSFLAAVRRFQGKRYGHAPFAGIRVCRCQGFEGMLYMICEPEDELRRGKTEGGSLDKVRPPLTRFARHLPLSGGARWVR